jgi:antitoxin component YwqK of YwqJK toxin-antitoxin module
MVSKINMVSKMNRVILFLVNILILSSCNEKCVEKTYYDSGKLKEKIVYPTKKDKKTQDNYTAYSYSSDEYLEMQYMFKNGALHGALLEFYKDGDVKRITNYKNGKKYGVEKLTSTSKRLVRETFYINDSIMLMMKSYNSPDGYVDLFYYAEGDSLEDAGRLVYDEDFNILKKSSFHYNITNLDTLEFGKVYQLDIETFAFGADHVISKFLVGEYDEYYNFINEKEVVEKSSSDNKISIPINANKKGYNIFMGKLYIESLYSGAGEENKLTREFIIYEDYFVE